MCIRDRSRYLLVMVKAIKKQIDVARFAVTIRRLDLGGFDLKAARETAILANQAIQDGAAGYVLITARKPA